MLFIHLKKKKNPVFQLPSTLILLFVNEISGAPASKIYIWQWSAFPFDYVYLSQPFQPDALTQISVADDHTRILSCWPSFACGRFPSAHVLVSLTQSTAPERKRERVAIGNCAQFFQAYSNKSASH